MNPITAAFLALLCTCTTVVHAAEKSVSSDESQWVRLGSDGRLIYRTDAKGNRIPDFSNVGYRGGGVPLPTVPVRRVVEPMAGDATARIQAAIDALAKLPVDAAGQRGAVLLRKGRYQLAGSVRINASGIVLRGEGQGEDGTLLVATGTIKRSLIIVGGRGDATSVGEEDGGAAATTPHSKGEAWSVTDAYVPVGARSFHLNHTKGLKAGMRIVIRRPSTAEWIHDIGMDRIPAKSTPVTQWKPGTKDLLFDRIITAVEDLKVTVEAPLVAALERRYGGGQLSLVSEDDAVREVGVENLRGDSEYTSPTDENHGWVLVELGAVRDAWVRDVTSVHFGYGCVNTLRTSSAITIDHCTCLDPISQITGGRRYSFALDGQLTLVRHCRARGGRHDFAMHSLAAGPNVFFDCIAVDAHADSGPHHRWSVGVLYDQVVVTPPKEERNPKGVGINIRNRGNSGSGHGWAGANQVVWNSVAYQMEIQQPPTAQNWAIGCRAVVRGGDGYWQSVGQKVQPESLYLAQLAERLQTRP